jgi:hypothetical protein
MRDGDVRQFLSWYMPGLSLLAIGGSFVELTSSAAAAWALAKLVGQIVLPLRVSRGHRPGARSAVKP